MSQDQIFSVGVATHTDIVGDVVERRSRGETGVIARRHAPYFLQHGVNIICDHAIGDTFETLCFPTSRIVQSLFPPQPYAPSYLKHNLLNLTSFLDDLDDSTASAVLIRSSSDLDEAQRRTRLGIVLCFQGCSPLEENPEFLRTYFRLGVRVLNLSSALVPNLAIGHAQDPDGRGLTNFGRDLVALAAELGMIIDLSGCSERGFWDVLEAFSGPVMASSTNCRSLHDRPSNFTDSQIKALGERSGIVGVIFNVRSVGDASVKAVVQHILHIADTAGPEATALGPNVVAQHMYPKATYERIFADVGYWSGEYPDGLEGFDGIRCVCEALGAHGWDDALINGFRGANAFRLLQASFGKS